MEVSAMFIFAHTVFLLCGQTLLGIIGSCSCYGSFVQFVHGTSENRQVKILRLEPTKSRFEKSSHTSPESIVFEEAH